MFQYIDIKKFRVRFVNPRKTITVYDKTLAQAKLQACKKTGRNWNDAVEITRV